MGAKKKTKIEATEPAIKLEIEVVGHRSGLVANWEVTDIKLRFRDDKYKYMYCEQTGALEVRRPFGHDTDCLWLRIDDGSQPWTQLVGVGRVISDEYLQQLKKELPGLVKRAAEVYENVAATIEDIERNHCTKTQRLTFTG